MWCIEQIERIKMPMVNKFYLANRARGKAKSHERVWVVKSHSEIVAAARVADISGHDFLTGVQVAEGFQRQGIARALISELLDNQQKRCYTFPYRHLVDLYLSLGFEAVAEVHLPKPLLQRFERYTRQGRDIDAMVFGASEAPKTFVSPKN